jgi:hypothetical protein
MRTIAIVVLGALLVVAFATTTALAGSPRTFVAPLNGAEEVLPDGTIGVDTRARGVAIFQLSRDGTSMSYRLVASNIENVTMAHIHCCAGAGANAGIAVWLYPDAPPAQLIPGRHDGVLATGTITADDVIGMTFGQLVDAINAGTAYVNVHTSQLPSGEIRGQLP